MEHPTFLYTYMHRYVEKWRQKKNCVFKIGGQQLYDNYNMQFEMHYKHHMWHMYEHYNQLTEESIMLRINIFLFSLFSLK